MNTLEIQETKQYVVIEQDDTQQTIEILEQSLGVIEVGIQGPEGAAGANGDKNFVQAFSNTSSVSVHHSLNKYPSVTVLDSANDEVEGSVFYTDLNNVTISFSAPFSGTVTLN